MTDLIIATLEPFCQQYSAEIYTLIIMVCLWVLWHLATPTGSNGKERRNRRRGY